MTEQITKLFNRFVYYMRMRTLKKAFFQCGTMLIRFPINLYNPHLIMVGDNFVTQRNLRLEAFPKSIDDIDIKIVIKENVHINWDVHIGALDKIIIEDNVLIGSRVLITDHSHGRTEGADLRLPPDIRPLYSKGPVIIHKNVWLGEGVCVMPGVTIGENTIVGANSVVTKSLPSNCIAGGIPAKILRYQ